MRQVLYIGLLISVTAAISAEENRTIADAASPKSRHEGFKSTPKMRPLRGILLISDEGGSYDLSQIQGLQARDVNIPGGVEKLKNAIDPVFVGKPLSRELFMQLKEKLVAYFRAEKTSLVLSIPKQSLEDGVIQIVVKDNTQRLPINGILLLGKPSDAARIDLDKVRGVEASGVNLDGMGDLKNLLGTYLGKPLTKESLSAISQEISSYLKEKQVSHVVSVPAQRFSTGVLQLIVEDQKLPQDPKASLYLSETPQIVQLKGLLLVPSEEDVEHGPLEIEGLQARDMDIPGGVDRLNKQLEPIYLNQPLTQEVIVQLKRRIVLYYRDHNRPVVDVDVPEQDVTDGVLQLVVVESRLGKVYTTGNRYFSDSSLRRKIRIRPGHTISTDRLLSDIAWINRNPFRHVDAVFTPGEEDGTTDIRLIAKDRFPLQTYIGGDNTGTKATGNARWFAGAKWGNVLGFTDHIFTYQFTTGSTYKRFHSHTGHYIAPLPWHHNLICYGGYSHVKPRIEDFHSQGRSWQVSGRYQAPFGTSYKGALKEVTVGFDFKNTNNNLIYEPDGPVTVIAGAANISQFMIGYSYGRELKHQKITFNIDFFGQPAKLVSHQTNHSYEELRPDAKVYYGYGRFTLGDDITLPLKFMISLLSRGQGASNALLPSEQFGLGGYDTVRGYDEREFNADNGFCGNFEFRFPPFSLVDFVCGKKIGDQLTFLGFVDYGVGNNYHRNAKSDLVQDFIHQHPIQHLLGVGPGFRYTITRYLSGRFDWGFKLVETPFHNGKIGKLHLGLVASY